MDFNASRWCFVSFGCGVQMLQSELVNQQKTASAVREEGERIMRSQAGGDTSSSAQDSMRQLDDSLALLESRLGRRVDAVSYTHLTLPTILRV